MERSAGILLPAFSLPGAYGIGSLGREARAFAEFLHNAGQRWWQVLPVGPTGAGNSPYTSESTFAGNPLLIDLEDLRDRVLLTEAELSAARVPEGAPIDYAALYERREPLLRRAYENWSLLIDRDDRDAGVRTLMDLGDLGSRHIYLHLLYVRWFERFGRMGITQDRGSREDQEMLEELQGLPEQLSLYQQQVQRFFDLVLDVDKAGRDPQQQASAHYLYDAPKDPSLFSFRPIPLSFEPVEPGRCSPVLYPLHISDMIDYSLRSCVERGITVRRCKNCGRWFPQTGRVSAEYCERPVASGQQTCREAGAFQQWTKKQSDDPVFKAYRKEYKKRFAWIKAGRITDEQFYAWSEQAREMKKKCDREVITLEEFQDWLKNAKVPL